MFKQIAAVALIGLSFSSCHSGSGQLVEPKQRLSEYISKSFTVRGPGDRAELVSYLTGDAKAKLLALSEEDFKTQLVNKKRQFIKLTVNEIKKISAEEVGITYELIFLDETKGKGAKITNKKLAQLKLEAGQWLISEVKSVKELVEYKDEMSLP